ncbi:MAG: branched-chain amino acid ABC transporter permease [Lautropia sp.]
MMAGLVVTQVLNGLQYGVLLFLLAAGLTLIFGIMDFVNLAHGSLYMLGAFFTAAALGATGSFLLALAIAVPATVATGVLVDRVVLAGLYSRTHLDQVLATFGLVLFFNELVVIVWGSSPLYAEVPDALSGTVQLFGFNYSSYRFAIIGVGLGVAVFLWWLINRTRIGMLIRAGASNAPMVSALGVDIRRLNMMIFGLGAGLAGLAGAMMAPIFSVQSGMGDSVLIQTLVVIIVGGIGSIRGAFLAALIIGVVDTIGKVFLPIWMGSLVSGNVAQAAGPAIASMLVYLLMAIVLAFKPGGLFPVRRG